MNTKKYLKSKIGCECNLWTNLYKTVHHVNCPTFHVEKEASILSDKINELEVNISKLKRPGDYETFMLYRDPQTYRNWMMQICNVILGVEVLPDSSRSLVDCFNIIELHCRNKANEIIQLTKKLKASEELLEGQYGEKGIGQKFAIHSNMEDKGNLGRSLLQRN